MNFKEKNPAATQTDFPVAGVSFSDVQIKPLATQISFGRIDSPASNAPKFDPRELARDFLKSFKCRSGVAVTINSRENHVEQLIESNFTKAEMASAIGERLERLCEFTPVELWSSNGTYKYSDLMLAVNEFTRARFTELSPTM